MVSVSLETCPALTGFAPTLPHGVLQAKFRLVWKRGDKVASSRELGKAEPMVFDESLSLVCTMYRDPALGSYAEKEASFALHMTGPRAGSSTRQLARATLDLSKFAGIEAISEELKLVLLHDGDCRGSLVGFGRAHGPRARASPPPPPRAARCGSFFLRCVALRCVYAALSSCL